MKDQETLQPLFRVPLTSNNNDKHKFTAWENPWYNVYTGSMY